jgi:hypothetical protein
MTEILILVAITGFIVIAFYLHAIRKFLRDEFSHDAMRKPLSFRRVILDALKK